MNVLFIGGSGNISTATSRLCVSRGIRLFLLNRGNRPVDIDGCQHLVGDIHNEDKIRSLLKEQHFDVVVDWIAFTPADIERDIRLFEKKAGHFIFISSASAYQKPPDSPFVIESTPLANPYWGYSREKIACEELLMRHYRSAGFPVTIVRPSLTYDTVVPAAIGGWGCFTLIDRIRSGKKIIIHGDGTSLQVVTHANDFAKGIVGLLGNTKAIGEAFHITTNEILTWNQIYQAIADGARAPLNAVHIPTDFITSIAPDLTGTLFGDKAWSLIFDNAKIRSFVPDFTAEIPFAEGIKKTIAWFDAGKERQRIDRAVNAGMDAIIDKYES